ncbi:MAG: T9SS type A sorting domain-containing protein [Bacteroidia bacterium]|nr:T9SS type A sorting domain-containing protein [Bacteroidia bacterium]
MKVTFDISHLAKGVYMVKVNDYNLLKMEKIIIK